MFAVAGSVAFLLFGLLGQTLLVSAQTSNATCEVSHKWALNSQGQTPCTVAASLVAVCTGSYEVPALPDGYQYVGPSMSTANDCWCNTVVYSLLAECALCQDQSFSMWSVWELNCKSVSVGTFPKPIPAGLHVPGWAYLDVEASDFFNETLAFANANLTESTAIPQPTPTPAPASSAAASTTSSSAAQASTTVPVSSDVSGSGSESKVDVKRSNAIGGSIVGGFAAGLVIAGLAFWIYYRRRRTAKKNGAILQSAESLPAMSEVHTTVTQPTAKALPSITVSSLNSQPSSPSLRSDAAATAV